MSEQTRQYVINEQQLEQLEEILDGDHGDLLDAIADNQTNFQNIIERIINGKELKSEDIEFLVKNKIHVMNQQQINIYTGRNQPRVNLNKADMEKLDPKKRYAILFVQEPVKIDIIEKHAAIIKKYDDGENMLLLSEFIGSLTKQEIIDLLSWKIDEAMNQYNVVIDTTFDAPSIEEKCEKMLLALRQLIPSDGLGMGILAWRLTADEIRKKMKSV